MKRFLVCILMSSLVFTAFAAGQGKTDMKNKARGGGAPALVKPVPVTEGEAEAVFRRMEKAMKAVLNITHRGVPVPKANGSNPTNRAQVIAEFDRMYEAAKTRFRFSPTPVQFEAKRLAPTDSRYREPLEKLIRMGFVAKLGPLAAGPGQTLTAPEFGDAIGFFMARMAELTHTPNTKWTPYLQKDR